MTAPPAEHDPLDSARDSGADPWAIADALRAQPDGETRLLAAIDRTAAKPDDALAAHRLVAVADALGAPAPRARARRHLARCLAWSGDFAAALRACDEALEICDAGRLRIEAGRVRLASMHALGEMGRLEEALAAGLAARERFAEAGEHALAARADLNIGIAQQRGDRPREALASFDRARPHLVDEPAILGHLENSRGEALNALDDFAGAEDAYAAARAAFERAGLWLQAAVALGNLAELAWRRGSLQAALATFESARRLLERQSSPAHLARLVAEQAELKAQLGLGEEALAEFGEALQRLGDLGLRLEAARARAARGRLLVALGQPDRAERDLAEAAESFEELQHAASRARVDAVRAEIALAAGDHARAERLAVRARASLADRPAEAAQMRHLVGRSLAAAGRREAAEAELQAALADARRLDLAPLVSDILVTLGAHHAAAGRRDAAVEHLREAVERIESLRGALRAARFRAAFLGRRTGAHELLVAALVARGGPADAEEAWRTAERARSRALLDRMDDDLDARDPDAAAPATDRTAALRRERTTLEGELSALYVRLAEGGLEGYAELLERIRARERRLGSLESRMAAFDDDAIVATAPPDLAEVRAALRTDEVLLEYVIADAQPVLFAITRTELRALPLAADATELDELVRRVRFQIDRALRPGAIDGPRGDRLRQDAERELDRAGALLMEPCADLIRAARRVAIVPAGPLHGLPFAALRLDDEALVAAHDLVVAPSAGVLARLRQRSPGPRADAAAPLIVGVPDAAAPEVEPEVRAVAQRLAASPDRVLLGDAATVAAVVRGMRGASMVHLAGHAVFHPGNPEGSGMRLADGWLDVRTMRSIRPAPETVVLGGCETARATILAGDELSGPAQALIASGARRVVASLWRVRDEDARALVESFHDLAHTRDATEALAEAMRRRAATSPHPATWAPFVVAGA